VDKEHMVDLVMAEVQEEVQAEAMAEEEEMEEAEDMEITMGEVEAVIRIIDKEEDKETHCL